ncbi:MAG: hypothetical protein ACYCZK_06150 [Microbacteriaceae bacterium]
MPRSSRWADRPVGDRGSAAVEFVVAGLILLLPLVYLVLTVAAIQGAAFAVEGAARQAVRVFAQSSTVAEGRARAQRAMEFGMADYGVDQTGAEISIDCSPNPDACLSRLGLVTVTVRVAVALPLVPQVLTMVAPLKVPLQAVATEQVSRFRRD